MRKPTTSIFKEFRLHKSKLYAVLFSMGMVFLALVLFLLSDQGAEFLINIGAMKENDDIHVEENIIDASTAYIETLPPSYHNMNLTSVDVEKNMSTYTYFSNKGIEYKISIIISNNETVGFEVLALAPVYPITPSNTATELDIDIYNMHIIKYNADINDYALVVSDCLATQTQMQLMQKHISQLTDCINEALSQSSETSLELLNYSLEMEIVTEYNDAFIKALCYDWEKNKKMS